MTHLRGKNDDSGDLSEKWISYSSTYQKDYLTCPRCGGKLYEEFTWDLPDNLREYACIICGYRVLVDLTRTRIEGKLETPSGN